MLLLSTFAARRVVQACTYQNCHHKFDMTDNVEACMLYMTCFLAMQNCVHGTSGLQSADQGVCFIPSAAHDSRSTFGQHHVHAKGNLAFFTMHDAPAIWSESSELRQQNSEPWCVISACVSGHAAKM